MKKIFALFLATFVMGTGISVSAGNGVSILVDGENLDFTGNQPPIIKDGTTLVPFRAVFEKLGAYVEWSSDTQLCEATLNGIRVSTAIGDKAVYVDDDLSEETNVPTKIPLAVPAQIVNGRTMVPLRVLSESLGLEVNWDNTTRTVSISSKQKKKVGSYTYVTEHYENVKKIDDGTNYLYASADYPQFEGTGIVSSVNTQIENSVKKAVDSFVESYDKDALNVYTNATEHLFEPPYSFGIFSEVSNDGDIVSIKMDYYEVKYDQEDRNFSEVINVNMKTGEVVE